MDKNKVEQFLQNIATMHPMVALPTLFMMLFLVLGLHFGVVIGVFYLITLATGLAFTFINTAYFWLGYVFYSIALRKISPRSKERR